MPESAAPTARPGRLRRVGRSVVLPLVLAVGCRTPPVPIPDDIRVIRNLSEFPVEQWPQLEADLRAGQKMILIGTDPFAARVWQGESEAALCQRLTTAAPVLSPGATVVIENFTDWDYPIALTNLTGAGNSLAFTARGDKHTSRLTILGVKPDGSHWFCVATLTPQARLMVVHEAKFQHFYGGDPRAGFRLADAQKIVLGLNMHLGAQSPGRHELAVTDIRFVTDPRPVAQVTGWPDIMLLSPPYRRYALDDRTQSPLARARGPGAPYRWTPLVTVRGGWPVSMYSDDRRRYVWIASDNPSPDWINRAVAALQSPPPPPINPTPPQRLVTDTDRVTTAGAFFTYRGRPLFLNGVNYWPLSHNGKSPGEFAPHWLEPSWFDPEIITRDLNQLQRLRVNAVAIQYHEVSQAPQLRWFVNACRQRGIWVHCFIGHLQPLDQNLPQAEALIRAADIPNLPGLFAIDIAWEPHLGLFDQRQRFQPQWEEWLTAQYGSLANARAVFGRTTGPTDDELRTDQGPHLPLVNAYRRFVDDYFSRRYGEVVRFLRNLGCRQLLSARTGYGGNGNHWADPFLPLDLGTGAEHFDFICPEGYALNGDSDQFNEGCFLTAYARAVSAGKPVVWMEYGCSVSADPQAADLENQARLYRNMYQLLHRSAAAGAFAWWYPGGWRVDEKSDMGIVAPDNQPRPAARVIAQAGRFPAPIDDALPPLLVDPTRHATGLSGLWDEWRETFRREMREVRITPPSR